MKAKKVLENSRKIYNCDVALNSIRCPGNRFDITHNLENTVYNELLYMGYKISVYNNNGREIDFLAEKGNYRYFIQVAYSVAEENTSLIPKYSLPTMRLTTQPAMYGISDSEIFC